MSHNGGVPFPLKWKLFLLRKLKIVFSDRPNYLRVYLSQTKITVIALALL